MSTFTHSLSTNNYGPNKFVVSASAANGTHTTIAAATTAASSGDTIFIRDGTYTEDFSAKAGVNYTCSSGSGNSPTVTIIGKVTCTGAGTFSFANIRMQTNSDFALVVSGSSATVVQLNNVYINCTNNTGISFTTSNVSAAIDFTKGTIDLATTGIAYYSMSSTGSMFFRTCILENSGGSSTAASNSAGSVGVFNSTTAAPFANSSTGIVAFSNNLMQTAAQNATTLTTAGTNTNTVSNCFINSGSASCISIGSGTTVTCTNNYFNSSNTNAITGAGAYISAFNAFTSSKIVNATTQTYLSYQVINQVFTGNGTYTPTTGMKYCSIRILGAGGGGGGAATSGAANCAVGGTGGGGEYAEGIFTFATIGTSQTVTIGAAGAAGTAGNNAGGTGGTTSVGSLITAIGGTGGPGGAAATVVNSAGGAGGTGGSGGDFRTPGNYGDPSFVIGSTGPIFGGNGANSQYGSGARGIVGGSSAGNAGLGYGAGGGSGITFNTSQVAGGAGTAGLVVVTEYIIT